MKFPPGIPLTYCFLTTLFLAACSPADKEAVETVSVTLEKKADGLTYIKGSHEPYTGQSVTFTHGTSRQAVETWEQGKAHGTWQRYWSTGHLKREQVWERGAMTHQRQWHENGVLKEDMPARNGIAYGQVRLWWPDGRVRRMAFVEEDLNPHGHVLEYAEDGTVLVDAIFDHGQFVSGLRKEDSLAPPATAQAH